MTLTEITRIVRFHGYADVECATADNVTFICRECESIASVTPGPGQSRETQRDLLLGDLRSLNCCGEAMLVL